MGNILQMRQGGGVETMASNQMEEMNPMKDIDEADMNNDGIISGDEIVKQQVLQQQNIVDAPPQMGQMPEMACGGLMGDMMGVTIGIESDSGNEIPAGSLPEEVADDIPAMLSEGEYVVPADVVRWHGLKHLEMMRKEAKMGLGLMASDGRIAEVDEETKEPVNKKDVDYDIEEKDKPEVEVAEVEIIEAAEGTDVQTADSTQPFYQLRYVTDPVTGRVKMAYVDPATGQQVSASQFEEERASRFAPETVLTREGLMDQQQEEEPEEEECPEGYVKDPATGTCVLEAILAPETDGGDGPQGPEEAPEPSQGMTTEDIDTALANAGIGYTTPTPTNIPGAVTALGVFTGIPVDAIARGIDAVKNTFNRNKALGQIRAGENLGVAPTGDYADWRGNLGPQTAGAVAQTENEARGVTDSKSLQGTSFGSVAEAQAVAEHGWGSDEAIDAIESGFSQTDQFGLGDEGTDLGDAGEAPASDDSNNDGPSSDDPSAGMSDEDAESAAAAGDFGGFAKGGMPVRKNTPLVKMMKY